MQQIWRLTWMTMVLAACTLMVATGCRTGDGDNENDNIVANDNDDVDENVNDNDNVDENVNDNTGEAPDGAALFDVNCGFCHPGNAPDLTGTAAADVIAKLEGGHNSAELTTEEIDAIAAFVESL